MTIYLKYVFLKFCVHKDLNHTEGNTREIFGQIELELFNLGKLFLMYITTKHGKFKLKIFNTFWEN